MAAAIPGKAGLESSDLTKGEPRLLNIFASWCVPCMGEAPVLMELKRRGVKIDAIAVRDTPEAIAAFLAEHGDPYERLGSDPRSNTQMSLGSSGVPETFIVGQVRAEQFDGCRFARVDIDGFVDGPHSASAEAFADFVGAQPLELHGSPGCVE